MADGVRIDIKPFSELALTELHACLKLRGEVFVVGQQICAVPDVDAYDPQCEHVMYRREGVLIGTARLLPMQGGAVVKVGRVAVDQACRGQGVGRALMRAVQAWVAGQPGRTGVMSAQAALEGWYAALGWQRVGGIYREAGIDHVEMVYRP